MNADLQHRGSAGLWHANPSLVQLLGLSPLLAVSDSVVKALGLGLATLLVLACSSLSVSLLRRRILPAFRLAAFMMIIATFTTCIELLMQAWTYPLYVSIGIFVPLIVSNAIILSRADLFASHHAPLAATVDALITGVGFAAVLLVLGLVREALGTGHVFAGIDQLLPFAVGPGIQLFDARTPFLLAILPPGAFLLLGLLIALKNVIDKKINRVSAPPTPVESGSKRVRVTGKV